MNQTLIKDYKTFFRDSEPEFHVFSPYCVCPLGAHVDHQHGLVSGFALDKGIDIAFSTTDDGSVEMVSLSFAGTVQTNVHTQQYEHQFNWGDYLRGVLWTIQQKYVLKTGIRGVIRGSIPSGGIASSAALLCGLVAAIAKANHLVLPRQEVVELASKAERLFVGLNNGILDQSCVSLCQKNQLLFLDTDSKDYRLVPFGEDHKSPRDPLPFKIVIFYSGVTRSLTTTDYNLRVQECRTAANILQAYEERNTEIEKSILRRTSQETFNKYVSMMPPRYARRARHFFTECERVEEGMEAWRQGEIEQFGELMFESCESSILNYECGSPQLIAIYRSLRHAPGVYGARFCGAGFIGSCFALVDPDAIDAVREQVARDYIPEFPMYKDSFCSFICDSHGAVEIKNEK